MSAALLRRPGLPSCNTILHNCKYKHRKDIHLSNNMLVKMFCQSFYAVYLMNCVHCYVRMSFLFLCLSLLPLSVCVCCVLCYTMDLAFDSSKWMKWMNVFGCPQFSSTLVLYLQQSAKQFARLWVALISHFGSRRSNAMMCTVLRTTCFLLSQFSVLFCQKSPRTYQHENWQILR